MRLSIITTLLLIICSVTGVSFADEKADCINACTNEKRARDMYCPPAGGYTDDDNKQCVTKNSTDYTTCKISCSPPSDQQPAPTQLPANQTDDAVTPATQ